MRLPDTWSRLKRRVTRLLKLSPNERVSNLEDIFGPYRRPQDPMRYTEGLRMAGTTGIVQVRLSTDYFGGLR